MAVVILGGLVTSTVLNLFLMPALYLAFGRGRDPSCGPMRTWRPGDRVAVGAGARGVLMTDGQESSDRPAIGWHRAERLASPSPVLRRDSRSGLPGRCVTLKTVRPPDGRPEPVEVMPMPEDRSTPSDTAPPRRARTSRNSTGSGGWRSSGS